jgi:hypothetical protein
MADINEGSLPIVGSMALTDYVRVFMAPGGAALSENMTLANFQAALTALINLVDIMVPPYQVRTTANFSKTSDTTLANVPGLSVNVAAGKNYRFTARLHIAAGAGGSKVAINGSCTAGAIIADAVAYHNTGTSIVQARSTSLGGVLTNYSGADPFVEIWGMISVTVSGTLTVQFAQNGSSETPSTVLVGSTLFVEDVT